MALRVVVWQKLKGVKLFVVTIWRVQLRFRISVRDNLAGPALKIELVLWTGTSPRSPAEWTKLPREYLVKNVPEEYAEPDADRYKQAHPGDDEVRSLIEPIRI